MDLHSDRMGLAVPFGIPLWHTPPRASHVGLCTVYPRTYGGTAITFTAIERKFGIYVGKEDYTNVLALASLCCACHHM